MNPTHFLEHLYLKKNKKGQLRAVSFGKPRHPAPPHKTIRCQHCGIPRSVGARESVVAFTCSSCIERERLARAAAG